MNFTNIAIVGSNGFIGTHLTQQLLKLPSIKPFLFGKNDAGTWGDKLPYTKTDLTDSRQVKEHFSEIDLVYYLASETIPSSSWENPGMEVEKNLKPFLNFMECIVPLKVKKVVFISSAGTIYGASTLPVTERSFTDPFSPYGITKLAMEHYLNYFRVRNKLQYDIYRVSNLYGEGQNTKKGIGIINTFLENITAHNKIQIFGNGEHVRNYMYINDLASLVSLSLFSDPAMSNVFNAASNDTLTINELVAIIKKVVKEDFEIVYTPTRQSDNPAIYIDNAKMLLAYPDFKLTTIEDGIRKTYEYIKQQKG